MTKPTASPAFSSTFLQEFARQIPSPAGPAGHHPRGRPPRLPAADIVAALAWHVLQPTATFAHNLARLTGLELSDSALSERRQALGTSPWREALAAMLRPVADPQLHPRAFYKGLCLKGVDGTTFNVANTPAMKCRAVKTKARRGSAAFHRVACVALVELGTHTPVSVRVAENGESESTLAGQVTLDLRETDLLIGDRYYGNGKWAARLRTRPQPPRFLLRVQERLKAKCVKRLPDGSSIVTVRDPDTGEDLRLREIRGGVRRPGQRWVKVRFWTNLLDHQQYPAHELLQLYGMRWEQEIAFRELKHYLQDDNLLLSHTPVTAVQEICALFMAQAVVARIRSRTAANHEIPVLQVSFAKTLHACRNFGWLMSVAGHILSPTQLRLVARALEDELAAQLSKTRRHRSCPRMVRQPINKWHRLLKNHYEVGKFDYQLRHA